MSNINRQITLASRPSGFPTASDFHLAESPMCWPARGQVLVQAIYLSVDPYMRGRMNDAASYARPLAIGEVMPGGAVGRVLESSDPQFAIGGIVQGMLGWQDYAVLDGGDLRAIDDSLDPKQGKLKYREDVVQGLENAPRAFIGMLQGRNFGKQLVQVSGWTA
jgi:NADPH-dependent curcumin reductase CurA